MTDAREDIFARARSGPPVVMGILNVTPDSFSDGGRFLPAASAVAHARHMVDAGADILDLGAESTRPGADRVGADEQIRRLEPILPEIIRLNVPVSVDTTRSPVAEFALDAGAAIINDVSAGRDDPELLAMVAGRNAGVVLMHMLGQPATMQSDPRYDDVVTDVCRFLTDRVQVALDAGVRADGIWIDPGIGFGKRLEHNLALLAGIDRLSALGLPVLLGASRKRFIGELTGQSQADQRVAGSVSAVLAGWRRGASVFRVHDVAETVAALQVAEAIEKAGPG